MKVARHGAMIRIHMLCNNSHSETWDSSPSVGTGPSAVAEININLASYTLLTGLHIKQVWFLVYHILFRPAYMHVPRHHNLTVLLQVLDFFSHLKIMCFGASFYYKLQQSVLLKVVWMAWLFSQARYNIGWVEFSLFVFCTEDRGGEVQSSAAARVQDKLLRRWSI